jgi:hypothetical protein
MKKVFLTMMLALCLVAGCGTTPAERVDKAQQMLTASQAAAVTMDKTTQTLEGVIAAAKLTLADPTIDPQQAQAVLQVLNDAQDKLDKLKPIQDQVSGQIADLQKIVAEAKAGGDVDLSGELKIYSSFLASLSPYLGSFAVWGQLAALILAAVAGVIAKRKSSEATSAESTTVDVVNSVSDLLTAIGKKEVATEADAKKILRASQDSQTRVAVNLINARLKEPLA